MKYKLDDEGRFLFVNSEGDEELPFSIDEAINYRFDFESKTWIYDPIIMIPQSITRYQGMIYLYRIGKLKELEAKVIENAGEVEIAFYNSINWERYNDFVI